MKIISYNKIIRKHRGTWYMYDEKIVTKVCDTLVKAASTLLRDITSAYKKAIATEDHEQSNWTLANKL